MLEHKTKSYHLGQATCTFQQQSRLQYLFSVMWEILGCVHSYQDSKHVSTKKGGGERSSIWE